MHIFSRDSIHPPKKKEYAYSHTFLFLINISNISLEPNQRIIFPILIISFISYRNKLNLRVLYIAHLQRVCFRPISRHLYYFLFMISRHIQLNSYSLISLLPKSDLCMESS